MESPFPHYGPLRPDEVTGRDEIARELELRLTEHRPTALLAPRRYGKTSLIGFALRRLDDAGTANAVRVDLFGVTSFSDFAARLDQALVAAQGRLRQLVDRVAAAISVNLGVVNVELRGKPSSAPDPVVVCHGLLEVLTRVAADTSLVVAFDEFSDVTRVPGLEELLRTHLQEHYRQMGLVFAGSRPSMMRELFTAVDRPFFSQAEVLELGVLDQVAMTEIVHRGFLETRRGAGPVAQRTWALARGHPQRTMQLADAAWQRTAEGADADLTTWADGLAATRASVDGGFRALYDGLPGAQGAVLRAVARTGSAFSAAESRYHDLSNSSITLARDHLVGAGHLLAQGSKVQLVDPLFADWLARTFP